MKMEAELHKTEKVSHLLTGGEKGTVKADEYVMLLYIFFYWFTLQSQLCQLQQDLNILPINLKKLDTITVNQNFLHYTFIPNKREWNVDAI